LHACGTRQVPDHTDGRAAVIKLKGLEPL